MKTIEEILQERLAAPVRQKSGAILTNDQGEPLLPLEAMIMSVMTNAMRGDIAAIAFIQNLTKKQAPDDPAWRDSQQQQLIDNIAHIKAQLDADHIYEPSTDVEIDRLANSLLIIQRLEAKMREPGHEDVTIETNRSGQRRPAQQVAQAVQRRPAPAPPGCTKPFHHAPTERAPH